VSTQTQYEVYVNKYNIFCRSRGFSLFEPSLLTILEFLLQLYKDGAKYSTINSARSALSLYLPNINNNTIGKHPIITRFVKGVSKLKPPTPRYNYTWDIDVLLKLFESWEENSQLGIKNLTYKLISLLAIITAQRVQTLQSICISNINHDSRSNIIVIKIPTILKTSKPGVCQPLLKLSPYPNQKICVVNTLNNYLAKTLEYRNHDNLFLTLNKPWSPVTTQTISRWLRETLELAGVDTNIFKAHSFRHASTSRAFAQGVDIDNIFERAGWSANSTVFARFYNRPIYNVNHEFPDAILSTRNT